MLRVLMRPIPLSMRHRVRHVPVLAAFQRWLIAHAVGRAPFVHRIDAGPAKGLRLEVALPQDKAMWGGVFEPEFSEQLRRSVQPGDVCYDVGGYRGYMTGVLALAGAGQVIVFEPMDRNAAALRRLAALNPQLPLRIEPTALGAADSQTMFKVMPDESMGKLADSPFQVDALHDTVVMVRLRRIDTLVFEQGYAPPNVIKIDVEGAEADVIHGASRTLAKYRPRVLIEAHSAALADRCRTQLTDLGFRVWQLETHAIEPEAPRHLLAEAICAKQR
jgi:FkbM family methyltransferase